MENVRHLLVSVNYLNIPFVEKLTTRLGGNSPNPTRQREASAVMADDGCRTPAHPCERAYNRTKNPTESKDVVKNWMRVKDTLKYLGLWEIEGQALQYVY